MEDQKQNRGCAFYLKKDFELGLKVNFNCEDWRIHMCDSGIPGINRGINLIIRVLAALFYTAVYIYTFAIHAEPRTYYAYLTNWGVTVVCLSLLFFAYTTAMGYFTLKDETQSGCFASTFFPKVEKTRLIVAKCCWVTQSINFSLAIAVTILYFGLLYRSGGISASNALAHIINSVLPFIVLSFSAMPLPYSFFLYLYPITTLYILTTALIYATQTVVEGQVGYVYAPLNFDVNTVLAAVLLTLLGIFGAPLAQLVTFLLIGSWKNWPFYKYQPPKDISAVTTTAATTPSELTHVIGLPSEPKKGDEPAEPHSAVELSELQEVSKQ